jgi:hypothetical protein
MTLVNTGSFIPLLAVLSTVVASGTVRAETRRLAVVVGNNVGNQSTAILRYAEADAGKVARILVELGGVFPDDLFLLQGRTLRDFRLAIDLVKPKATEWHREPDTRVLLLFYFSGHSDGEGIELGSERISFSDLKRSIATSGADVRVVIIDSCKSGALLQSKGGARAVPFEIKITDDFPKSGEVVITSSAADEASLESSEIRGSFFTHHLTTGLRGAADRSGDGQVSLTEAYDYAFDHTRAATANTVSGTQHPSFDYRISGQGELILTEFRKRSASLTVPPGFQRILVTQLRDDQIVAELNSGASVRLALEPGAYSFRAWRQSAEWFTRIELDEQQDIALNAGDLVERSRLVSGASKGNSNETEQQGLSVELGMSTGIAQSLGPIVASRVAAFPVHCSGFGLSMEGATGKGRGFSEYRAMILAGYRATTEWRSLRGVAGIQVGGGATAQTAALDGTAATPWGGIAPIAGVQWGVARSVAIVLDTEILIGLYRRDGVNRLSAWPAYYLGVTF